jgi:tRNA modification GTPase
MQLDIEATICAIATGHEHGSRGAVRVAGWSCLQILQKSQAVPHGIIKATTPTRVHFEWNLDSRYGTIPVDIWYWPTERSYTGTPAFELHTLGNTLLLNRIVEQLCQAGARLALPGEFTLRAFLAGRIDLTQCEAVLGVIEAKSQATLDVALRQLAGGLAEPLKALRQNLVDLLADLEAGLDFVDEDIEFISREQVIDRLDRSCEAVERLVSQLHQRQHSDQPPRVAMLGLPNAGKSSLVNAIAKQNAAIVSDTAGTTRDFVRVRCSLPSGEIELVDTAGIDSLQDEQTRLTEIDRLAQGRSLLQRDEAELVLYCIDCELDYSEKIEQLQTSLLLPKSTGESSVLSTPFEQDFIAENVWILWTKAERGGFNNVLERLPAPYRRVPSFATSSIERRLLQPLLDSLSQWLEQRDHELSSVAPMTATRCHDSLRSALEALQAASHAADQSSGDEIVASEIRLALEQLASVAGEVYTDDVLDSLFSRFCIGK